MKRARILIADDHPLTLEGVRAVLDPFHDVVGMVTNGRDAIDAAVRLQPDLTILDITMPMLNGIDAAARIRNNLPEMKLLFVTMHVNPAYLEAALHSGGTGFVLKTSAREELLTAVERVLDGHIYITPGLSGDHPSRIEDPSQSASGLTSREREVLQLIAEGGTAKDIAFALTISVKTVAFHRENIKKKLKLRSTAELTRHAIEQGLVSFSTPS